MKRKLLLLGLMCSLLLAGCGAADKADDDVDAVTPADTQQDTDSEVDSEADVEENQEATPSETSTEEQMATLYIGTKAAGFEEYDLPYEGELTPELLIQGIADLTGWDLTLDEPVTTGKGGMSVCLSEESALFVGPPESQKEEFFVFDATELAEMILDSIQETLQRGFTGEGGDPSSLDIYYYLEGDKPLELPNIGLSWSIDEPYQWKTPE